MFVCEFFMVTLTKQQWLDMYKLEIKTQSDGSSEVFKCGCLGVGFF